MPKLDKKAAEQVDQAEAGSFLLPDGRYAARLRAVAEKPGNEYPYWAWEFDALHDPDGKKHAGRQWINTSLSPKAAFRLKEVFEAFGYTTDTDTDELIGEWCVLTLVQKVQEKGKGAGNLRNEIANLSEFDSADWPFDQDMVPASAVAGPADPAASGDDF